MEINRFTVTVGVGPVSFANVVAVARTGAPARLSDEAVVSMERARSVVEVVASAATSYASRRASARWRPGTSRPRVGVA